MKSGIDITVVLCTYNGCGTLPKALESIVAQVLPDAVSWEILVVDNNSGDGTREVVEDFCRRVPGRIRYLFEPEPGLSSARNAGIRAALGEIVAFTDDDVIAESTWLENLTGNLRDANCAGAGGRILPAHAFSMPRWLSLKSSYALAPLALFEPDSADVFLAEPPFGANMAFRKAMFGEYGYFRTDLGRSPGSLLSNEDTEFGSRLIAQGQRLRYEPAAIIYHPVPDNRIRKEYFLAWWLAKGRSDIRQSGVRANTKFYFRGVPLYLFRNLAKWSMKWMVTVRPPDRFQSKIKVWLKVGEIVECYRQRGASG